jgi:hypothetical protein
MMAHRGRGSAGHHRAGKRINVIDRKHWHASNITISIEFEMSNLNV